MAYFRYYGTRNQPLGQQYNEDGSSQIFFTGNLHHRQSQNQNDQVDDDRGDISPSLHQQKLYDIRAANRIDGNHSGSTMPQRNLNLDPTFNNRSGFNRGHPAPQWFFNPQPSGILGLRCPEGPYQDLGSNQFAHQLPGHQQAYHPSEEFVGQYLPQPRQDQHNLQQNSGNNFVPDAHNQMVPEVQNPEIHVSHNHHQNVSGTNSGLDFYQNQHNLFDGSAQEKSYEFSQQQSLGNNDPLQIQHMAYDSPGTSDLEMMTTQQMKESPRTQQLTLQMEQHNLLSPELGNFQNNSPIGQTPQQLAHQRFQKAQNELLEAELPDQSGNNEGDDQWKPIESLDGPIYESSVQIYVNNENDQNEWMELDTPDCNNEFPTQSTDSTASVNFFMDNNGVPLPLVRVQKSKAARQSVIPKVSTSRLTSLENNKRRENALQLSPPAKPSRVFKERFRPKENTAERENNRGYSKIYRDKQKTILEMAKKEKNEALEKVQELQETTFQKEKILEFAIKLLTIMGKEPEDDEGNLYEMDKQNIKDEFGESEEKDVDINAAKTAKDAAKVEFEVATHLVQANECNASRKSRAKKKWELKSLEHAKLVKEHDYKRELELERLIHFHVCHAVKKCRPLLDPSFRSELKKKMQEHEIQEEQLDDFIGFIDSHSSLFKPPTEQEDKVK